MIKIILLFVASSISGCSLPGIAVIMWVLNPVKLCFALEIAQHLKL